MQNGWSLKLARCLIYMAVLGAATFPLGRFIKRLKPHWEKWPFRGCAWERNGTFYERLGIRRWKDIAPDVSWVFPKIVPPKKILRMPNPESVIDMLRETCVAEAVHWILCAAGLALPLLWPGKAGVALCLFYILLGNGPFIMIQRYNRPRYRQMLESARRRERRLKDAGIDTVVQ